MTKRSQISWDLRNDILPPPKWDFAASVEMRANRCLKRAKWWHLQIGLRR
jgi:hypothetical protein